MTSVLDALAFHDPALPYAPLTTHATLLISTPRDSRRAMHTSVCIGYQRHGRGSRRGRVGRVASPN